VKSARLLACMLGMTLVPAVACGGWVTLGDLPNDSGTATDATIPLPSPSSSSPSAPQDASKDASPYDPCEGKSCGATCTVCPPADPNCLETAVVKNCHVDGVCRAEAPICGDASPPYDSCAGKVCGATCTLCRPGDLGCFETAVLKECSKAGACSATPASCN
jgi:hypothetical protein